MIIDARTAFKTLYREARLSARRMPAGTHPMTLADAALNDVLRRDTLLDYHVFLDKRSDGAGRHWNVFNAVNMAIAWATGWDMPDRPMWGSIARVGFKLTETRSRVWFEKPHLPA